MSNETQMADTIEMLYKRLNEYNKQDLFNYGYLLESNQILCKGIEEKDKEIARLNNIIFTAIERLQDYDLVENKQKVIDDVFDILRGENKE